VGTAAVSRLDARIGELPEGSLRRKVLESARRFKASWVDLGRMLAQVRREEAWREWGHPSFEDYCTKELFLRRATAEKLALSYGFLERHEPELARARDVRSAPPFEVIEVLSRAEAAGRLSEEGYRELRSGVLEGGATRAAVSRALDSRFGPEARPGPPAREARLERLAVQARRLAEACAGEDAVPSSVTQRAEGLAEALERLAGRA
jgi:predicted transcriptional regulator